MKSGEFIKEGAYQLSPSTSTTNLHPELRRVNIPSNMKHPEWREPTWSFLELAQKLGLTPNELKSVVNTIGNFPKKRPGIYGSGSKAFYNQSELKRWVRDNNVREFIKSKQGVAEGSNERSQNRLWAQITDYEKRAKATSNDIKKQHYLKMADELRGKLKTNVDEGVNNVSNKIKALYQKIYNAGDDEVEYFYNDSPIFAQYWDEYEGDLDSIIAEADPQDLQVILDELESYVQQANLAEGIGQDMAKLGGIAALGIGAGLGANYVDQQQPRVEVGGQKAYLIQHPGWGRVPDNAMTLQGKDGKTYTVWASKGKGSTQYYATPADNVKEGVAEAPGAETLAHNQSTVASNEKAFDLEEGKDKKPEQPEADYGDDYQAMVARVKKLAGLGPLKTVYDPQKRVYKNVPTAVQPGDKK